MGKERVGGMINILFIGNSHTYYNDMPMMVRQLAVGDGYECRVVMIAHGGWFLMQHVEEPDVRFNILYGGYDYVVLQEHAHPLAPEEQYVEALETLNSWIRKAGSIPVIYETWTKKDNPGAQEHKNAMYQRAAEKFGALLAPVGETWWAYKESYPELELYDPDGGHASPDGSAFAAKCIWETIREDLRK